MEIKDVLLNYLPEEEANSVYQKIKKLSEWIREYNKMGFKLNIPSVEFKIPLKEVYNDYRINDENNGTNQRN